MARCTTSEVSCVLQTPVQMSVFASCCAWAWICSRLTDSGWPDLGALIRMECSANGSTPCSRYSGFLDSGISEVVQSVDPPSHSTAASARVSMATIWSLPDSGTMMLTASWTTCPLVVQCTTGLGGMASR